MECKSELDALQESKIEEMLKIKFKEEYKTAISELLVARRVTLVVDLVFLRRNFGLVMGTVLQRPFAIL